MKWVAHVGVAKKFICVFQRNAMEKPEWTFLANPVFSHFVTFSFSWFLKQTNNNKKHLATSFFMWHVQLWAISRFHATSIIQTHWGLHMCWGVAFLSHFHPLCHVISRGLVLGLSTTCQWQRWNLNASLPNYRELGTSQLPHRGSSVISENAKS